MKGCPSSLSDVVLSASPLLCKVIPNGAGYRAGMRTGDVIVTVDGDRSMGSLRAVAATALIRDRLNGFMGNPHGRVTFGIVREEPAIDAG